MADTLAVLAQRIAALERLVRDLSRTSRLANSSIESGALTVYDGDGTLRASIGLQGDGTVAVAAVNGPTPPVPSAPAIASVLGGVAVSWDGTFADGSPAPADFAYAEVHFSASEDFPDDGTLYAAFYSAQGGTMTVPTDGPVWVRLVCVSTSGVDSGPSAAAGPAGPAPVVAQAVLDGIVTALSLADAAVTSAKLAAAAVDANALAAGAVTAQAIGQAAVTSTALADGSVTTGALAAGAVTAGKIAAGAVTAGTLAAGAVTAGTIAAGAVTTAAMTAGSINGDRLAAGSIAADRLVAQSITAAQIQALGITGDRLTVNTITADKLAVGSVTAASLAAGAVNATALAADAITGKSISGGTITGAVVTGSTLRTGSSGRRIELVPDDGSSTHDPVLRFYTGVTGETSPATAEGQGTFGYFTLKSPEFGQGPSQLILASPKTSTDNGYIELYMGQTGGRPNPNFYMDGGTGEIDLFAADGGLGRMYTFTAEGLSVDTWHNVSWATGWTNFGGAYTPVRYRRIAENAVRVWGVGKRTATTTPGTTETLFTLPTGYRPLTTENFTIALGNANGGQLSIDVQATGTVLIRNIDSASATRLATGSAFLSMRLEFALD